jgi:tellurite resistance protein TerC
MFGILGALVLRAIMILIGAWLIAQFHWILYLFGAFLVFTGIKMWVATGHEPDLEANPALKWIRRHMQISPTYDGEKFFTVQNGVRLATPLFVVILLIAIVDIVFAVDSIPAIFAITMDPFIVLTSNVFAILGLRAMYFMLAGMHERFHLLSYGLAIVLVFIGTKMLLLDIYKIPVSWSLGFTVVVLVLTMFLSLKIPPKKGGAQSAYPFAAKGDEEQEPRDLLPCLTAVVASGFSARASCFGRVSGAGSGVAWLLRISDRPAVMPPINCSPRRSSSR